MKTLLEMRSKCNPLILREELINRQKPIVTNEGVFIDMGTRSYADIIVRAYSRTINKVGVNDLDRQVSNYKLLNNKYNNNR